MSNPIARVPKGTLSQFFTAFREFIETPAALQHKGLDDLIAHSDRALTDNAGRRAPGPQRHGND